jgi:hypothetical protein
MNMALCKAAGVIHMRTLLRAKGDKVEVAFIEQLTFEEKINYETALPASLLSLDTITRMYTLAVPLIYTGSELYDGLRQLGYDTAKNDMKGVYNYFLRLVTPNTAIKQAAKIWKTYHTQGRAMAQRIDAHHAVFQVCDYPELSETYRELLNGYIQGLAELTKIQNAIISRDDHDPNCWQWDIQWN